MIHDLQIPFHFPVAYKMKNRMLSEKYYEKHYFKEMYGCNFTYV